MDKIIVGWLAAGCGMEIRNFSAEQKVEINGKNCRSKSH